ncbi:MAG: hypothetical protein WCG06_04295 [Candidatus Omnitrophota bacterium]
MSEYEMHSYLLDYELIRQIAPGISEVKFTKFKEKYFKKYNEVRERYLKSKTEIDLNLLSKYKPSSLFEFHKKEEQRTSFYEKYDKDDEFMQISDEIANNWRKLV